MSDDTSQRPDGSAPPPPGADLGDLAALAREIGAVGAASEADAVARRLSEGLFYVACVGQFKRGKSTLLNALVGRRVPARRRRSRHVRADRPEVRRTAKGPGPPFRGRLAGRRPGSPEPGSRKRRTPGTDAGVEAVEVFLPSPLSLYGMCLVDTPGSARSSPETRWRRASSSPTSTPPSSSWARTRRYPARSWRSSRRSRARRESLLRPQQGRPAARRRVRRSRAVRRNGAREAVRLAADRRCFL